MLILGNNVTTAGVVAICHSLRGLGCVGQHFRQWQQESGAEEFPDVSRPLGVQCNLCVDEYTEENGGTMFVPSSFQRARQPPPEFKDSEFVPPDGA